MNDSVPSGPRIAIDRVNIKGVDATTAKVLGPAIEMALGNAAITGRVRAGHRGALRLELPAGATARDIARALARALEGA